MQSEANEENDIALGAEEQGQEQQQQQQEPEPLKKHEAEALIGRRVLKDFNGVLFEGVVTQLVRRKRPFWWKVFYPIDGDREDLAWEGAGQLSEILQPGFAPLPDEEEMPTVKQESGADAGGGAGEQAHGGSHEEDALKPSKRQRTHSHAAAAAADVAGASSHQHGGSQAEQGGLRQRSGNARQPAAPAPVPRPVPRPSAAAESIPSAPGELRRTGLAGHLLKIRLEDFMCHELFEMDFGPHVTLVSGTNGSGKSAVMQGLQASLGVSARNTGRATSLAQFIRTGQNEARVQVTLCNTGPDAFEPDKFGDRIIIERRISRGSGGSYWKALNQAGKVVSDHKPAEVLRHLGINAANPLTIITQDMARAFLSGSSEDKKRKYNMFMEGTLLNEIRSELAEASTHVNNDLNRLKELKADFKEKQEKAKEVEARLKKLQALQGQVEVRQAMDSAAVWAAAWEMEQVIEGCRDKVENLGPQRQRQYQQLVDDAREALETIKQEEEALNASIAESQQEARNAAADLQRLKEEHAVHVKSIRRLKQKKEAAEAQQKDLEAQKRECEKVLNEDIGEKAQQRREAMEKLQADLSGRREALQKAEDELTANRLACSALQAQMDEVRKAQGRIKGEIDTHVRQMETHQREIQQMEGARSGGDNVVRFGGQRVLKLLQLIRNNARRFSHVPVGPVGAFLGLRDSKWARAMQMAIGGGLETFLVHNMQDASLLREMAQQAGYDLQRFSVVKTNFDIPPHNVPRTNVPAGLCPVMSMLTVSEPSKQVIVMNWLVDSYGVERSMLVENSKLAMDLVWGGQLRRCFVPDGTQYQLQGKTRLTTQYNNRPVLLGLDNSEILQQLREGVESSRASIREAEGRLRETEVKMGQLSTEYRELQRQQTELGKRKKGAKQALDALQRDLTAQQQAAAAEQRQGDEMDELATQVQSFQAELLQTQVQLDDIETKLREAQEAEQAARKLFEDRKQLSAQQPDRMAESVRQLDVVQKRKAQQEQRLQTAQSKLADVDNHLAALQAELQGHEDTRGRMREVAAMMCSEEEARKALEVVRKYQETRTREKLQEQLRRKGAEAAGIGQQDIEALVADTVKSRLTAAAMDTDRQHLAGVIAKAERDVGADEKQLNAQLKALLEKLTKATKDFNRAKELGKLLNEGLKDRLTRYQDLRDNVVATSCNVFHKIMVKRQHMGRLQVDDEKEELTLEVKVKGQIDPKVTSVKDLKQLSGGERSYTTVAFLVAMGQHTEAPFRCMDEFDVFMDAINRRVATELLLEEAYNDASHQYVFLTPQDIQAVDDAKKNIENKLKRKIGDTFLRTVVMRPARP